MWADTLGRFVCSAGLSAQHLPQGAAPRSSEAFVFLGGGKAGDVVAAGGAFGADAGKRLVLRTGFSKDDHGAERFGVHPCDQVGVAGAVLFPELANLNLCDGHGCKP